MRKNNIKVLVLLKLNSFSFSQLIMLFIYFYNNSHLKNDQNKRDTFYEYHKENVDTW